MSPLPTSKPRCWRLRTRSRSSSISGRPGAARGRALGPMLEKLGCRIRGPFPGSPRSIRTDEPRTVAAFQRALDSRTCARSSAGSRWTKFMGVLPESQLRAFIERIIPRPRKSSGCARQNCAAAGGSRRRSGGIAPGAGTGCRASSCPHRSRRTADRNRQHDEAASCSKRCARYIDWGCARRCIESRRLRLRVRAGSEGDLAARVAADPDDLEARLTYAGAAGRAQGVAVKR